MRMLVIVLLCMAFTKAFASNLNVYPDIEISPLYDVMLDSALSSGYKYVCTKSQDTLRRELVDFTGKTNGMLTIKIDSQNKPISVHSSTDNSLKLFYYTNKYLDSICLKLTAEVTSCYVTTKFIRNSLQVVDTIYELLGNFTTVIVQKSNSYGDVVSRRRYLNNVLGTVNTIEYDYVNERVLDTTFYNNDILHIRTLSFKQGKLISDSYNTTNSTSNYYYSTDNSAINVFNNRHLDKYLVDNKSRYLLNGRIINQEMVITRQNNINKQYLFNRFVQKGHN